MHHLLAALLIAATCVALGGCGQTGPLYMPTEEAPQAQPDASGAQTEQPSAGA